MTRASIGSLICGVAMSCAATASEAISMDALDYFEKSVRPLLVETCYECHSDKKQEGELRLDGASHVRAGGASGTVIDFDDLESSSLLTAIGYQNEIKMPPDFRLDPEEVEVLRAWVLMGAPWPEEEGDVLEVAEEIDFAEVLGKARETHWAFRPVSEPDAPVLGDGYAVLNAIDAFVQRRLADANVEPSDVADRRTLIRRLYYDLTGLPPTLEAIQVFETSEDPDAYEHLVEELLASPHFGERWGRHWLDVARYADTKGYVFEEERMFPYSYTYRDYVIRAFNEDLPYDQFIVEQLAADQLELGEDKRALAGLGYLTLGRRFLNRRDDIIDDRIDVVTRGMLGLTVTCARCHEHKYDPIPAEDYYALYGVFRSTKEPGTWPLIEEPDVDDPGYQEFVRILEEKQADLEKYERDKHRELLLEVREEWQTYFTTALDGLDLEEEPFKKLAKDRDIRYMVLRRWTNYLEKRLEEPDAVFLPLAWYRELDAGNFENETFCVTEKIEGAEEGAINPLVREAFMGDAPESFAAVVERYVGVLENVDDQWRDQLAVYAQLMEQGETEYETRPSQLDDENAESLRKFLYGKNAPGNIPSKAVFGISETPVQQEIRRKRRAVARHEATHLSRPDRAMALEDVDKPFDPYVFLRGKPANKGDTVDRRFLQILTEGAPEPFVEGSGRLELARAIADPANPLTARVYVNRVWMHLFDQPLVDTPSDFGLRSQEPTHPELLDHLAGYFVEQGWSTKQLLRYILTSHTYRQLSESSVDNEKADVENRLLWRQNKKRLDFESMRDALLAVSGELDLKLGGPPESLTKDGGSVRRTVYGMVERQNMAGFIKAFDFASPDTHSPKRFQTVVPQQALYLMNSTFAVERAKALETRLDCESSDDIKEQVTKLFRACLSREPTRKELKDMVAFVTRDDVESGPPPAPLPDWRYGYGEYDAETGQVERFTEFGIFDKTRWQPREAYPDDEFGHVAIGNRGGHPGRDAQHAAIHRWIAPRDGTITVDARLRHESDKGDGVLGYIVSSRDGLLHEAEVFNGYEDALVEDVAVKAGDTIDFVAAPNSADSYDGYKWAQTITMSLPEGSDGEGVRTQWEGRADFAGPAPEPPAPLTVWGQLAQVLLMTNEFMYID